MATSDKSINFVVSTSGGAAVAANTVLAVGTNQQQAARPSGFTGGQWTTTHFYQYCGGAFVPGFGVGGAFAMAASGGHSANSNQSVDASIFDFADYTWKCLLNTNGVTHNPYMFDHADIGGAYDALNGTSDQCPPPCHNYRLLVGVGSTLILLHPQYGAHSAPGRGECAWRCTLNNDGTCTWSRLTNNSLYSIWGGNSGDQEYLLGHYDPSRSRIWSFSPTFAQFSTLATFRPGVDTNYSGVSYSGLSGTGMQQSGSIRGHIVNDTTRDCFWCFGANGQLYRANRADPPAALTWTTQTSTGLATYAHTGTGTSAYKTTWHEYPVADGGDGCFYTHAHAGQSILKKFNPDTRVFSLVTIANGPTLPTWNTGYPGHYSRFIYVPYRKCFAWIPGGDSSVYLVRPPVE